MKKSAYLLSALSIIFMALPGNVLASTLSFSPASGTANQGCSFPVSVIVDTEGIQSDGTDAIIIYDTSRFSAQTITNGNVYPDFPGNNIDPSTGKITISGLASVSSPFTGKGTLATINFVVKETAPVGATQVTFDFNSNDKAKTTDSNVVQRETVVDTLNSVTNGSYIIGTGACGSAPAPKGTSAPRVIGGPVTYSTPSATKTPTIDQIVDAEGKGPGTIELTSAMAIFGGILTVLGILGLALL